MLSFKSSLTLRKHCNFGLRRLQNYKGGEALNRVKSGKIGHQVNSDTHLQTVEIQMRRLIVSRLIRIFTVCLVYLFFIPITEL